VKLIFYYFQGYPAGNGTAPVSAKPIGNGKEVTGSGFRWGFRDDRMGYTVSIFVLRSHQSLVRYGTPFCDNAGKTRYFVGRMRYGIFFHDHSMSFNG
jgi:hypothetical protein